MTPIHEAELSRVERKYELWESRPSYRIYWNHEDLTALIFEIRSLRAQLAQSAPKPCTCNELPDYDMKCEGCKP